MADFVIVTGDCRWVIQEARFLATLSSTPFSSPTFGAQPDFEVPQILNPVELWILG